MQTDRQAIKGDHITPFFGACNNRSRTVFITLSGAISRASHGAIRLNYSCCTVFSFHGVYKQRHCGFKK